MYKAGSQDSVVLPLVRPQTLDLLVLVPATDLFWRSQGDGKIKKSKIVLLFLELGFLTLDSVEKKVKNNPIPSFHSFFVQ